MNKLNLTGAAVLSAAILSLAPTARAENLNKSFTSESFLDTTLGGTTVSARPELAGTVLADVVKPFTIAGNVSGTVQNRVVKEDGTGTLDFYWRVLIAERPVGVGVTALRIGDFGYASIVDADWRIDGLGATPATTGRVFNPAIHPEGDINFLFTEPITAGGSSKFFFLHTDAKSYDESALYDLTGSGQGDISASFSTFAPAKGVPDGGSSLVLLSLGLLSLGALARRRAA